MELAASCQPFENSNVRVRKMTTTRREKLLTGGGLEMESVSARKGSKGRKGSEGIDERALSSAGMTVLR